MSSKCYVGNISFSMTEKDLEDLFSPFGSVASAKIITDRETGRSRGFGFVEMSSGDEAQSAVDSLNGSENGGRTLKIDIAKDKPSR